MHMLCIIIIFKGNFIHNFTEDIMYFFSTMFCNVVAINYAWNYRVQFRERSLKTTVFSDSPNQINRAWPID